MELKLLTDPIHKEADLGVIFMDSGGYLNMCGHRSIGCVTVAVEAVFVNVWEPYTDVILDTPAGLTRAKAKVKNGKAEEVSILNVPSFLCQENLEVKTERYGTVPFDISFGGSFFALVDSEQIGLKICQENLEVLTGFGMCLRNKINQSIKVRHPCLNITSVDLVEIYDPPTNPKADCIEER